MKYCVNKVDCLIGCRVMNFVVIHSLKGHTVLILTCQVVVIDSPLCVLYIHINKHQTSTHTHARTHTHTHTKSQYMPKQKDVTRPVAVVTGGQ